MSRFEPMPNDRVTHDSVQRLAELERRLKWQSRLVTKKEHAELMVLRAFLEEKEVSVKERRFYLRNVDPLRSQCVHALDFVNTGPCNGVLFGRTLCGLQGRWKTVERGKVPLCKRCERVLARRNS